MKLILNLENHSSLCAIPTTEQFHSWLITALQEGFSDPQISQPIEINIQILDALAIQTLNHHFRQKNKPTNVLAFPADTESMGFMLETHLLGDIAICAELVEQQAKEQQKPTIAHWAHLSIHACLHLCGFDHIEAAEAKIMEALEIRLLKQLGFANPYEVCE